MKEKFINSSMSLIQSNKNLSSIEKDKMRYGLEGLYLTITKMIIIFILALILGILKEVVILLLLFNVIRYTAFGVHAKRSIDCLISSTLFFIGFPMLCIYLNIPLIVKLSLFLPIIVLIGIFAPSDTIKRPINDKKKRLIYKILSIIISIIYLVLSIIIKDNFLSNAFIFSLIIEVIVILPITYKIFGVPYNNHNN